MVINQAVVNVLVALINKIEGGVGPRYTKPSLTLGEGNKLWISNLPWIG